MVMERLQRAWFGLTNVSQSLIYEGLESSSVVLFSLLLFGVSSSVRLLFDEERDVFSIYYGSNEVFGKPSAGVLPVIWIEGSPACYFPLWST